MQNITTPAMGAGWPSRQPSVSAVVSLRPLVVLAALVLAADRVLGFGEALDLAGILALEGDGRALARALALTGVGAAALYAFGVRGGDEAAGGEDRRGRGDDRVLGHDLLPDCVAPRGRGRTTLHAVYARGPGGDVRAPVKLI